MADPTRTGDPTFNSYDVTSAPIYTEAPVDRLAEATIVYTGSPLLADLAGGAAPSVAIAAGNSFAFADKAGVFFVEVTNGTATYAAHIVWGGPDETTNNASAPKVTGTGATNFMFGLAEETTNTVDGRLNFYGETDKLGLINNSNSDITEIKVTRLS